MNSTGLAISPTLLDLPRPPKPAGAYSAVVIRGGLGFVSGQFPLSGDAMARASASRETLPVDSLKAAARLAALNVAAQIGHALGSWKAFGGLCRVDGIIAAPEGFTCHAAVLDAASQTFVELFGPFYGVHARSAISSPGLPGNAALELVVTFAIKPDQSRPALA